MGILPFKNSTQFSLGVELEYQILNPHSLNLVSKSKELIRSVQCTPFANLIKPEITQSMFEINSSAHFSILSLWKEIEEIRHFLSLEAQQFNVLFCGGGTHPFQRWVKRKIFPSARFRKLYRRYKYLSKRATVFGMHIHHSCPNADEALYLTHALGRYIPHFIALSASSPFIQGIDTGFQSARLTIYNSSSFFGTIPYLTNWQEFSDYYYKMQKLGVIKSIKDFHWDVRPQPELGTVEIRICDCPLTLQKAKMIVAYAQSLVQYLLETKPFQLTNDLYFLYHHNRFQATRYGYDGEFIDPQTLQKIKISEDLLQTLNLLNATATKLNNTPLLNEIKSLIVAKKNDASLLREIYDDTTSIKEVVQKQCELWKSDIC